MKIAILYNGQLRNWEDTVKQNQEKYIITPECDLYFYTYEEPSYYKQWIKIQNNYHEWYPTDLQNLGFKSEACINHEYNKNKIPGISIPNALQQWHTAFIGFCLVPETYDIYVRSRTDILFDNKIDFSQYDINDKEIYVPNCESLGVNDQFAFGSYAVMKKYFDVYLHHYKMFQEGMTYNPETYIQQHLKRQGVNINLINTAHHIDRTWKLKLLEDMVQAIGKPLDEQIRKRVANEF